MTSDSTGSLPWQKVDSEVWESWRDNTTVLEVFEPDDDHGYYEWWAIDFGKGKLIADGRCQTLDAAKRAVEAATR